MYFIIMNDGRRVERNPFGNPNMILLTELPPGAYAIEIVPEFIELSGPGEVLPKQVESEYLDVILAAVPDLTKKISVIKEVRLLLGTGLKECKDMVDRTPSLLVHRCPRVIAEQIKANLEKNGARIELRSTT